MTLPAERPALYESKYAPYFTDSIGPDYAIKGRKFWNSIAIPFLNNVDGVELPEMAIANLENRIGLKSAFGIQATTKQIMIESLKLKNGVIYGIIPDNKVIKTIGLWADTIRGLDIKTYDENDDIYDNGRIYAGNESLILATDKEFTFVGNPNDEVLPVRNVHEQAPKKKVLDEIKEQLTNRYRLSDREIDLILNKVANESSGAVIHLSQQHTNGLTTFFVNAGYLSQTETVVFGVNGYNHVKPGEDAQEVRVVYESPDQSPIYYTYNDGARGYIQSSSEDLNLKVDLKYISGQNYRLSAVNGEGSNRLGSTGHMTLGFSQAYLSIGFE